MTAATPIGYVVSVAGAIVKAVAAVPANGDAQAKIGALVKIKTPQSICFGMINTLRIDNPSTPPSPDDLKIIEIVLLGETLAMDAEGNFAFQRGVSVSPLLGAPVGAASTKDLSQVYAKPQASNLKIGTLHQDPDIPAYFVTDDLLGKHFSILGTTGAGKSCSVAVVLRAVLEALPNSHIILLDPHEEYAKAFGDLAEVVTPDTLYLPYWFLDFEESVHVFCSRDRPYKEVEANILKDAVLTAKHEYLAGNKLEYYNLTVDTPTPYRLLRVIELLKMGMGKLDKPESSIPFLRLMNRIDSLRGDRRFGFMFSGLTVDDSMDEVLGRLLRIPVDGKPLTIFNLAGVPTEIVDVVASLLCRMVFDFSLWSRPEARIPILLVCEEAHRYVPQNPEMGFGPTRRAISRIAKEGRKYGVSLGLVTQRPSEISESVLSQCNTLISLRMSNEQDQQFVQRAMPENAAGLLNVLPALRTQEAVVVGEGVTVPMRLRFRDLTDEERPRSDTAKFSAVWTGDKGDRSFLGESIHRWRRQIR